MSFWQPIVLKWRWPLTFFMLFAFTLPSLICDVRVIRVIFRNFPLSFAGSELLDAVTTIKLFFLVIISLTHVVVFIQVIVIPSSSLLLLLIIANLLYIIYQFPLAILKLFFRDIFKGCSHITVRRRARFLFMMIPASLWACSRVRLSEISMKRGLLIGVVFNGRRLCLTTLLRNITYPRSHWSYPAILINWLLKFQMKSKLISLWLSSQLRNTLLILAPFFDRRTPVLIRWGRRNFRSSHTSAVLLVFHCHDRLNNLEVVVVLMIFSWLRRDPLFAWLLFLTLIQSQCSLLFFILQLIEIESLVLTTSIAAWSHSFVYPLSMWQTTILLMLGDSVASAANNFMLAGHTNWILFEQLYLFHH